MTIYVKIINIWKSMKVSVLIIIINYGRLSLIVNIPSTDNAHSPHHNSDPQDERMINKNKILSDHNLVFYSTSFEG